MPLSDRFDNRQSQSRATLSRRLSLRTSVEFLEQARLVDWGNTNPCIADFEYHPLLADLDADIDFTAILGVLDRIFNQVV